MVKMKKKENWFIRIGAIIVGFILLIISIPEDVSIALSPLGIATGIAGVGLIVWGFTGNFWEGK